MSGGGAWLQVVAVAGVATVQDDGRPGHMHEGVPRGGALVPELHARANVAARNRADVAALEVTGFITVAARGGAVPLAFDDGSARVLREGESCVCRAAYVAVRGGIGIPAVLGGRGTLLVAALGGFEGRVLRAGDALPVGDAPIVDAPLPAAPDLERPIRVVLGPDLDRFDAAAVDVLLGASFALTAQRDRVGIRLSGAVVPRRDADAGVSAPMVRGAIQIPPSGDPIVLGPDHPTIGGYPVLATVVSADCGALAARRTGASVRFVEHR